MWSTSLGGDKPSKALTTSNIDPLLKTDKSRLQEIFSVNFLYK